MKRAFYTGVGGRRAFGAVAACLLFAALVLAAPPAMAWNSTDMTGTLPPLQFTMTRASDGKTVTAGDYKGKIVLLYFGYTFCPDVCPTTLFNIATMLKSLGKRA
ncbi:MAG: SCO family protein, partial [Xanthobacteraceae bacterium]